jgi:hypothetical protein
MRPWFIEETAFWRKLKGRRICPGFPPTRRGRSALFGLRNGKKGLLFIEKEGRNDKKEPDLIKKGGLFMEKESSREKKEGLFVGKGDGSGGLSLPQALK